MIFSGPVCKFWDSRSTLSTADRVVPHQSKLLAHYLYIGCYTFYSIHRAVTVGRNASKKSTPWFTPEIKELAQEKRKAFLKYISEPSIEQRSEYREVRNRVNARIREIKEGYWENFTADMEYDIYGAQKKCGN